jgi:Methyltransferase domain
MEIAFVKIIKKVNVEQIDIPLYQKVYLKHLIKNIEYYVSIFDKIIKNSLILSKKDKGNVVLIDYGCGNGLLGMYAKYCGVKNVILMDFTLASLQAAKSLSNITNIAIDDFVHGEIDSLPKFWIDKKVDIILGTDVIEHIYDLNIFFSKISKINVDMITCFTTGSNPSNLFKVNKLRKAQIKDEFRGGNNDDILLYGAEACKPFYEVRKNIIEQNFKNILPTEIIDLVVRTRGKKKSDIIEETKKYLSTKIQPPILLDKYNTCDPITGSWTERILKITEYKKIYAKSGFKLEVKNGYYNAINNTIIKNLLLTTINFFIKTSAFTGKFLAPFIIIYGCKKK